MTELGRSRAARRDPPGWEVCLDVARQPRGLVVRAERVLAVFGLERVDVDGSVGGLGRNVFVQGIPGDALDVVAMFGDLPDESAWRDSVSVVLADWRCTVPCDARLRGCLTCLGVVDPGNIVHAADDEVHGVRGPGQVVNLSAARATHVLRPP